MAAFEREVCSFLGLSEGHAVALSSGTAALFMALWALETKCKTVAIPVYSCAALRNAVLMAGAIPIAVDVSENSPNIDLDDAARKNVDVAVAAHLFGNPCRLDQSRRDMPIIEDCAQAFGARIAGQPVGLSGAIGVFSFYATKMITTGGQGGLLVSRDKSLVDAVRDYREFDCRADRIARFNFQMTDLQAAVGRAQLRQIDHFLQRRRHIYSRYVTSGLPMWPTDLPADVEPCHYRAILKVPDPAAIIARLEKSKVSAIAPIEEWELLDEPENFPRARNLARSLVSIPIYPTLTESEITAVIAAISNTQ